ncbi:uncharacterized protein [Clytia hemisphaerica]
MSFMDNFEAKMAQIEFQEMYGDTLLVSVRRYQRLVAKLGLPSSVVRENCKYYISIAQKEFFKSVGDTFLVDADHYYCLLDQLRFMESKIQKVIRDSQKEELVKPAPTEFKVLYGDTLLVDVTHYAELIEQMYTNIEFEAQFVRLPTRDYRYVPFDSILMDAHHYFDLLHAVTVLIDAGESDVIKWNGGDRIIKWDNKKTGEFIFVQ